MSATGLRTFDQTLQQTNTWLKDLMELMEWDNRRRAYLALRLTLHALRDRLCVESAAHLGAQLPVLVRGLYYEGAAIRPVRRSRSAARRHSWPQSAKCAS